MGCYILHTTYHISHILHTTYYILHTAYYILHTTYDILHIIYHQGTFPSKMKVKVEKKKQIEVKLKKKNCLKAKLFFKKSFCRQRLKKKKILGGHCKFFFFAKQILFYFQSLFQSPMLHLSSYFLLHVTYYILHITYHIYHI